MITLRDYQQKAIDDVYQAWDEQKMKNPLVIAPTGSGKSIIIGKMAAEIASAGGRVLVLAHVKELLEQNAEKIQLFTQQKINFYSASLNEKTIGQITVAGIQSIGKKATKFDPFDVILIDECHLIPRKTSTLYGRFIHESKLMNPKIKIVGFSATPYRMDSGLLHKGKDAIFDGIANEIKVKELIERGFLVPIVSKSGIDKIDTSEVKKRGGEYIPAELAKAADKKDLVLSAVEEIIKYGQNRKSWLIFGTSIEHAEHIKDAIQSFGINCEIVTGDTRKEERERILEEFKTRKIKALVNCKVLTTGFDAPNIDLIALLTATQSTGLYVQMLGRGTRPAEGKENCLLLDFGKNVESHGFFDEVDVNYTEKKGEGEAPVKECEKCGCLCHAAKRECPECGFLFPEIKPRHEKTAYSGAVMSSDNVPQEFFVKDVIYQKHKKEGKPDSVKITYLCKKGTGNLSSKRFSEWICPEHQGYARTNFVKRCANEYKISVAGNTDEFLNQIKEIPKPAKIFVRLSTKYPEITKRIYE